MLCPVPAVAGVTPRDWAARFDRMDRRINDGQGYCASLNNGGELAWGEGYILRGYVDMYRATGERLYLDSLVEQFERVLRNRDDVRHVRDYYRRKPIAGWGSTEYSDNRWHVWAVHTGMICLGPAEFIELVRNVTPLRHTYGAKADEFLQRIKECVATHDQDWRDGPAQDEGYYSDPSVGPLPLNQQNALGSVEVELYLITRDHRYRDRAVKLANYMKHRLRRTPDGAFDWAYWPKPDGSSNGSEDISHAAINVTFAEKCRFAHIVFDQRDMAAFARTWTRHVRRAPGEWADTVGGTGGPNTHIPQAIGRWVNLCQFDKSILKDAEFAFARADDEHASGAEMLGLAKIARWERETQIKKHVFRLPKLRLKR